MFQDPSTGRLPHDHQGSGPSSPVARATVALITSCFVSEPLPHTLFCLLSMKPELFTQESNHQVPLLESWREVLHLPSQGMLQNEKPVTTDFSFFLRTYNRYESSGALLHLQGTEALAQASIAPAAGKRVRRQVVSFQDSTSPLPLIG